MGGAGFPPCLLFGLRRPSTGGYRLFGVSNGGLQEGSCQGVLPRTSAASVLVPSVSHSHPPAFTYSLSHCFMCALQEWSLCFPSPVKVLKSNPASLQSPISWEFLLLLPDPQVGKPDLGLRTFTPVGGILWYNCSPVCESPTQWLWDLILLWLYPSYRLISASPLSLDVGVFFGKFQCLPADDCSAVSCDSGALTKGSLWAFLHVMSWKY